VWGLGFRVQGSGLKVQGLGCGVYLDGQSRTQHRGADSRAPHVVVEHISLVLKDSVFRVHGQGLRVQTFIVQNLRFRGQGSGLGLRV